MFDPIVAGSRLPHTHSLTKDQKDAFDLRTYKADNKDLPPMKEQFMQEPEPLLRSAIAEPWLDATLEDVENDQKILAKMATKVFPVPIPE